MSDFVKGSVAEGCKHGEFDDLDPAVRKKLLKIISRISESSYRRGFQHGKIEDETRLVVDPVEFRFQGPSLDHSPFTDAFYENGKWAEKSGMDSLARLDTEHPELDLVGLGSLHRQAKVR